jgi:hypothetical protein
MKLHILALFTGLILLASCSTNDKTKEHAAVNYQSVEQVLKPFSDLKLLDTFRMVLTGDKPKNMQIKLSIISHTGKLIYTKDIAAKGLLDVYKETVDLSKEANQIGFIKEEAKLLFDEENFLEPAVVKSMKADEDVPDPAFFEELKQSGLPGFSYRLGLEDHVYIAWSKKENKVKIYYRCC